MVRLLRDCLLPLRFLASCLFLAQCMVANGFSQITPALLSPPKMAPSKVSKQLLWSPVKLSLPDVAVKQISAGPERHDVASLTSGVSATFTLPASASGATLYCGDYSYTINVPTGTSQLVVTLTTATANADVDLFVRFGQDVALTNGALVTDFKSEGLTGNETITIPSPRVGTYYIAFALFTPNVAVTSTVIATTSRSDPPPPPTPKPITSGIPSTFTLPASASGGTLYSGGYSYTINVPPDTSQLVVTLTTATPNVDVDLFVRFGQDVALTNGDLVTDFKSEGLTGDETITIPSPRVGTYYIAFGLFTANVVVTSTVTATNVTNPPPPSNALIIPQFVNGGGWTTTLYLTNTSSLSENFTLGFYRQSGATRQVPIVGMGTVVSITGSLSPGQTAVYETVNSSSLEVGWAYVSPGTSGVNRISGFAIFRLRTSGAPDVEAIVTLGNTADQRLTLLYDQQSGYSTGFALVNPNAAPLTLSITVRDQSGSNLATDTISLPAFGHFASFVSERYASAANRKGSLVIASSGSLGFSVLGLRFSPFGSFTSFPPLK